MVDPERPNTSGWKPALAWLQRCAKVPTRVGQVWSRCDSYPETILVIGTPTLTKAVNHGTVARVLCGTCRSGWEHLVYSLDRGARFNLNENWFFENENWFFENENWFFESETGRGTVWRME